MNQFLLKTSPQPLYHYGQTIEVIGKIDDRVIKNRQVNFILKNPTIHLLARSKSFANQPTGPSRLNLSLTALFNRLLPSPHAGLLAGVLLGSQEELGQQFTQNLQKTGTIHLVVASGYNLSVVAAFCLVVLVRYLKRPFAIVFSLFGLIFYLFLAGFQPPLIRAALMAAFAFLAQLTGRDQSGVRGLILAAAVMLLVSPRLIFDLGFLLSVAATAGLLTIRLPRIPEAIGITLSAQIFALPLIFYSFGQFNLLSPVINFLVLSFVPLLMLLGALLTLVGWLPLIGQMAALLVYVPLEYFVQVINFSAKIDFAVVKIDQVPPGWALGYYVLIFNRHQIIKFLKIKILRQ
ncbi:MAG: ComEC/Rec2 family competence protein [Candidatus Shapirobacteria bacterium]